MRLIGTFKLDVVTLHELMFWEEPLNITAKSIMSVCDDMGAALDAYQMDWSNQALEESIQRMKVFIDGAKRSIVAQQPKYAPKVVAYITRTITLFNQVSQQNAIDWNNLRIKPPHKVFLGGRKRG